MAAPPSMGVLMVTRWVDYSNKYGIGYQLSNGNVGVYFNDATKMIISQDETVVAYAEKDLVEKFKAANIPKILAKKFYLVQHFKSYMAQNCRSEGLESALSSIPVLDNTVNLYVTKFMRNEHAVSFLLSNGAVQCNFFDHSKIRISEDAVTVAAYNGHCNLSRWTLNPTLLLEKENTWLREKIQNAVDSMDSWSRKP